MLRRLVSSPNGFGSLGAACGGIGYAPPNSLPFGINGKCWSSREILGGLQKLHRLHGYLSRRLVDNAGLARGLSRHSGCIFAVNESARGTAAERCSTGAKRLIEKYPWVV